jgi:DNA-binding ferritin-like protein
MGKNSYGDHLLFQRLYEAIGPEIDTIAEKIVGTGGIRMTNFFHQVDHMKSFMTAIAKQEPLAMESLLAEISLVLCGEIVMDRLEQKGNLTRGIEQALGNILDLHESHIYLLQQRLAK